MKLKITKTAILTLIMFHCAIFPTLAKPVPETNSPSLPWKCIAEKVRQNCLFFATTYSDNAGKLYGNNSADSNSASGPDYACRPGYHITIKLPPEKMVSNSLHKVDINLSKWNDGLWQDMGRITAILESDRITLRPEFKGEGLFRLQFTDVRTEHSANFKTYAIVSADWKKNLLAFCRRLKTEIETNPDPQLIRSSLSLSHFDHTMELTSKTSVLSQKILSALSDAIESKKAFDMGQYPDFVIGLNQIRLKRFEGSPVTAFTLFIPDTYKKSEPNPMFLHPDNRQWAVWNELSSHSGLIDLWWRISSHKNIEWKDYTFLMDVIEQKLNIDKDRIYIEGACSNGITAMALALNYPDRWAKCNIELGNSCRHLAGNALNLPLVFVRGVHNNLDYLNGYYNFAAKCFQYYGCKNFKHSETESIKEVRGSFVPETARENHPKEVLYTIESLQNPKAYWAKIIGREDENFPATINAQVSGQQIFVKTENIDAYSLDLAQAPIDANKPVEIIENKESLGSATNQIFTRKSEKYITAAQTKNEHLHGPVWDAFTNPYVIVWGDNGRNKELCQISKKVAKSLANGAPCFADVNMPVELLNSHNLILIGTPESNLWLSKIHKDLPVQIGQGHLLANNNRCDGTDMGFILVCPNPLNPEKYVAAFSGTSPKATTLISKAYSQMKSIRPADVGIFEVADNGTIKWHRIEKLNTVWQWHDQWDRVLAETNKKHPKWQWSQWIAGALRKQIGADVVIYEDPFKFEDLQPLGENTRYALDQIAYYRNLFKDTASDNQISYSDLFKDSNLTGQITFRKLCNSLRNDWIIKIKLDGKNLKDILSVTFNDISENKVVVPVISGVSFTKPNQDSEEPVLDIEKIENDKKYTAALPSKLLNGQRMGIVLKDYEIAGEGYLLVMLKDYLSENKTLDIDAQLDSLQFNVF